MKIETYEDFYHLNLEAPDEKVWDIGPWVAGSVQIDLFSGAWGSAVVQVLVSNNGHTFRALPLAVSFSADGISREIDLSGYRWLKVRTTTNAGAAGMALVAVMLKREREAA